MKEPCEEVKKVERRYEEIIDKTYQLIDRLKTERMSQAEFEQYAKEHGYIISTTNIIEQIRAEIEREADYQDANVNADVAEGLYMALEIIDKHK